MHFTESVFRSLILLSRKTFHFQKALKTVFQNANKVCAIKLVYKNQKQSQRLARFVADVNEFIS